MVFTWLGKKKVAYSIGWGIKEEVCSHTRVTPNSNDTETPKGKRRAVTRVLVQEKQISFSKSVTTKERLHRERNHSRKLKRAEEYTGAATKVERWAMPTWCHMFNSTLTGSTRVWFDDLPPESMNSYDDLKEAFLANFLQQKKVARQRVTQSFSPDLEISFPPLGDEDGTNDLMIIKAEIRGYFIHRIYIDEGSASEILYGHCFNRLRLKVKIQMVSATAPLIGFSGKIIWSIGQISLSAVSSTTHGMLKFPVSRGLLTLGSSKIIPLECTMVLGPKVQPSANTQVAEERIKVAFHLDYPEQIIAIDMIGVPRHIVEHRLNVREGCPPGRHKKRSQAPERNNAIQEEVERLMKAGIMMEVHYYN
nr:hypothetical protein [Tanacetum cinerariifolium]